MAATGRASAATALPIQVLCAMPAGSVMEPTPLVLGVTGSYFQGSWSTFVAFAEATHRPARAAMGFPIHSRHMMCAGSAAAILQPAKVATEVCLNLTLFFFTKVFS